MTTTTTIDDFHFTAMRRLLSGNCPEFWALQLALFLLLMLPVSSIQGLSNTTPTTTAKSEFAYRMAKPTDVPAIAQLLNDAFENCDNSDDNDTDRVASTSKKREIEQMLQQRMKDVKTESSLPHAFLIATTAPPASEPSTSTNEAADAHIAAFLELGTMPSPLAMERIWKGVPISTRPELPFVANLVVDPSTRRQKVGYTLLQLAMKIGKKWCHNEENAFLFLSVDRDNAGALAFYERLDFERIELSSSFSSSVPDDDASQVSAAKVYLKKSLFA